MRIRAVFKIASTIVIVTLALHIFTYVLILNDSTTSQKIGKVIGMILMNTIYQPWSSIFDRFDLWAANNTLLFILLISLNALLIGIAITRILNFGYKKRLYN